MSNDRDNKRPLPEGWIWTTIDQAGSNEKHSIVDGPFGSNLKLSDYIDDDAGVPVLTTKNLRLGYDRQYLRFISHEKFKELKRSEVRGGDILVAKIGSCGTTGIYPSIMPSAIIPANLLKMTVHPLLSRMYVYYYLNSPAFKKQLDSIIRATAQPAFSVSRFRKLKIPLAPLPEQRRIVAEIETQLTRLDAVVAALERAQATLARYKAAVLKAACEGRLVPTEAELARVERREYEPADVLLARILAERRARWEAENLGKKYKEPTPPDVENLPELPEGWIWAGFEQLLNELKNGYFGGRPATEPPGTPILRISAVRPLSVSFDDLRYLPEVSKDKRTTYQLQEGDLLFTRYNGNPHLVAACGLVRKTSDVILYPDKLIRVRVGSDLILPSYLEAYFATITARYFIESRIKTTAGQYGIAGGELKQIPVVVPPLAEQRRIVEEVERRLSVVEALEATVEANLRRAERLRQSILKRAFEGRLVPQAPSDEPASVLLARIQAEREGQQPKRQTRRKTPKRSRKKKKSEQLKLL